MVTTVCFDVVQFCEFLVEIWADILAKQQQERILKESANYMSNLGK